MSRLTATLRLDSRLQARNKIYLIVAVVSIALPLLLRAFFASEDLLFFMPLLALGGVNLTAFFLVAMILMLERGEGTLDVVMVSPLRPSEYLASKLISLVALAIGESLIIAGIAYGLGFAVPWLLLAVVQRAGLGVALGVVLGIRDRSIMRFIVPAIGVLLALDLPVLWYLDLWPSRLLFAAPTMPSLVLAKAAFMGVESSLLIYALVYGAMVVLGALIWASRSIDRFVLRGEQVR